MWYEKKQKLFFQYMSNSVLFSVPHKNNGPLSKCKLFIDSHGITVCECVCVQCVCLGVGELMRAKGNTQTYRNSLKILFPIKVKQF